MNYRGFTLIELLAVVLIMAILTAIAMPQYRKSLERSRVAEALQMLPVVFDARERLITERGYIWPKPLPNTAPEWTVKVTFPKLDIEMKGTQGTNARTWVTGNFTYQLFDHITSGGNKYPVSATVRRGTFVNTHIYYDGDTITCCHASNDEACEALNLTSVSVCS